MDAIDKFQEVIEGNRSARNPGLVVSDPYGQSFHMARFFVSSLEKEGLSNFLAEVRDSRDLSKTFEKHAGKTIENFYATWLDSLFLLMARMALQRD